MNGYYDFFSKMNDEEWEYFAEDILKNIGFRIVQSPSFGSDGGKDLIVENAEVRYLVSCKHYIPSGTHVGLKDEQSIIDRIVQHKTQGFIGFYSTGLTSGVYERFDELSKTYPIIIFDPYKISEIIPSIESRILFKYGAVKNPHYMNVSKEEYNPLECMICGKDIISDCMIPMALAGLLELENGELLYIWGCKSCLSGIKLHLGAFIEIEQALHLEQLIGWDELIDSLEDVILNIKFWRNKNYFESRIRQRIYPQNYGTWV